MMEEAEFELRGAISIREMYLDRLRVSVAKLESDAEQRYLQRCGDALLLLRQVTLETVEWIDKWRECFGGKVSRWNKEYMDWIN